MALNVINTGATYWDCRLKKLLSQKMSTLVNPNLSARQKQVLNFLVKGASNPEIAAQLNISPSTVKNHVQNIMAKLMVNNRSEMIVKAFRHGLIDKYMGEVV